MHESDDNGISITKTGLQIKVRRRRSTLSVWYKIVYSKDVLRV